MARVSRAARGATPAASGPSPEAPRPTTPVVGGAVTPSGQGLWIAHADGGVHTVGDAPFLGSVEGGVVDLAATPTGDGTGWLTASDGAIFPFGDARFYGSTGALRLNHPIVAMAATPTGAGYWLSPRTAASTPSATPAFRLHRGAAPRPTRRGDGRLPTRPYWLVTADGTVYPFGDAASTAAPPIWASTSPSWPWPPPPPAAGTGWSPQTAPSTHLATRRPTAQGRSGSRHSPEGATSSPTAR